MKYKYTIYTLIILMGLLLTACGGNNPVKNVLSPNVDFSINPTPVKAGQKVTFTGKQEQSSSQIKTWQWNFGDANSSTATGKTVTFTYQKAGSYQVVLTATDVNGKTAKATHTVTVQKKAFQASVAWSYTTGNTVKRQNANTRPAIGDNGTIYYVESFAQKNSEVVAVTDNGSSASLDWTWKPGVHMQQGPSIAPDGNIAIGAWNLTALNKINSSDGSLLWNVKQSEGYRIVRLPSMRPAIFILVRRDQPILELFPLARAERFAGEIKI